MPGFEGDAVPEAGTMAASPAALPSLGSEPNERVSACTNRRSNSSCPEATARPHDRGSRTRLEKVPGFLRAEAAEFMVPLRLKLRQPCLGVARRLGPGLENDQPAARSSSPVRTHA